MKTDNNTGPPGPPGPYGPSVRHEDDHESNKQWLDWISQEAYLDVLTRVDRYIRPQPESQPQPLNSEYVPGNYYS